MSLSGYSAAKKFQNEVQGLYGCFDAPSGRIEYLLTKARLGSGSTDAERRLTQHLAPVREVLASAELDFNQLLQRDLDDHRVATKLIPYLIEKSENGPGFFPPIITVALPFQAKQPTIFPPLNPPNHVQDELDWLQQDAGDQVRIRRLADASGSRSSISLGSFSWNSEFCQLVVIDGQHRAMALLAIDRTQRNAWPGSGGERYKYFYEDRVRDLLAKNDSISLDKIEVPVVLAWFPDHFGTNSKPLLAARKLFVDVNQEARKPSESRLILLSDSSLVNVLTRSLLSMIRTSEQSSSFLPLYAVEYDNPDIKTTQSARWSAMTNIHILKSMVARTVWGPKKYISDVTQRFGSREGAAEKDGFMRDSQLRVHEFLPSEIMSHDDAAFPRDELGADRFPLAATDQLVKRFQATWGTALLSLLSNVPAYKAHTDALSELRTTWLQSDTISSLAHEAVFNGVGMYWTLRDADNAHQEQVAAFKGVKKVAKPDVVGAWESIAEQQGRFERIRAEKLLSGTSDSHRQDAAKVYAAMNTHACQLGLALTLGTVHLQAAKNTSLDALPALAHTITKAISTWMNSRITGTYDRRLVLARDIRNNSLNQIQHLDSPRAVWFRYFWLEILASPETEKLLEYAVDMKKLSELRDSARGAYLQFITSQQESALKTSNPAWQKPKLHLEARKASERLLKAALKSWFGLSDDEWKTWLGANNSAQGGVEDPPESEDEETSGDTLDTNGPVLISDLISDGDEIERFGADSV